MHPHLSVERLDPVGTALLPVLRHFLDGFLNPTSIGWRVALKVSVETWGHARGLAIAYGVQDMLGAVLQARSVPLLYNDPSDHDQCDTLTVDELALLRCLAAMREDDTATARDNICRLTGANAPAQVVRTGLSLAALLDPIRTSSTPQKRPMLRSVS